MDINRYIRNKMNVRREIPPFVGTLPSTRETTIPEIFKDLGYKVGAEVGVLKGYFSRILFECVPGLTLYCIDPWTPYRNVRTLERQERNYNLTVSNLKGFDVHFIKKTSKDALDDIKDNSLDFVYIDALHDFDNVMFDIIEWSKKVRSRGIVSGHDFFYYHNTGVIFAVETYTRAHGIQQWFITKEYPGSWFWVRP